MLVKREVGLEVNVREEEGEVVGRRHEEAELKDEHECEGQLVIQFILRYVHRKGWRRVK